MKSRASIRVLMGAGFFCLVASYQNCGGKNFAFTQGVTTSSSCSGFTTTTENLRIFFMVDNSDSTTTSDPSKTWRVGTIQTFISQYGSQANLKFGYGWFAPSWDDWDASINNFVQNPFKPSGTGTDLSNALNAFGPLGTQNGTAYKQAFAGIQYAIDSVAVSGDGWNYVVVFMSDGQPTDMGSTSQQAGNITSLVQSLLADVQSHGAQATVSAVYFNTKSNSTAENNLQTMATVGGGQFVDASQGQTLSIQDIINVPCN